MRIAFFYAPVWIVVCSTLAIYIVTGREIFKKRAELRSFAKRATAEQEVDTTLTNPFTTVDLLNIKVETEMKTSMTLRAMQSTHRLSAIMNLEKSVRSPPGARTTYHWIKMPWNSQRLERWLGSAGKAEVAISVATLAMTFPKEA